MLKSPSKRPYLLRAMHQWITDSGHTPHVIVDAGRAGEDIPHPYVQEGKLVLNLSYSATQRLKIDNDMVEFDARFAGVIHHVRFPVAAVMGVYARETGEGMMFPDQDGGPESPEPPGPRPGPRQGEEGGSGAKRPQLRVVK
ncbi:MAG: ClpXP protease specificity-enhancing factor [Steroidobacteraceae bacterium]|jgi:stringent starvation protein B